MKRAPEPPLVRLTTFGQFWLLAFSCTLVVSSELGLTQGTGAVIGNVLNENGKSVAAAHVVVRSLSGNGDEVELTTESDGTYSHGNIIAGLYTVTANADGLSGDRFRVRIRAGQTVEINFSLIPGGRDAAWIAELGVIESTSRAFAAGLTATRAADHITATAVRLFTRATEQTPNCAACHYNLAVSLKRSNQSERAIKEFRRYLQLASDGEYVDHARQALSSLGR